MAPDDPFWNDGLFTNNHEPWAVDPDTQHGMRQIAYLDRAQEELRQIGWEVRCVMQWAVDLHHSLLQALTSESDRINKLAGHPKLESLSQASRLNAAMLVIHSRWIILTRQQEKWNRDFLSVFAQTKAQADDCDLLDKWGGQVRDIQKWRVTGKLSSIPGNISPDLTGVEMVEEQHDDLSDTFAERDNDDIDDDDDQDDQEDAEKQWVDSLDQEVVTAVISEAQVDSQTDEMDWLLDVETFEL